MDEEEIDDEELEDEEDGFDYDVTKLTDKEIEDKLAKVNFDLEYHEEMVKELQPEQDYLYDEKNRRYNKKRGDKMILSTEEKIYLAGVFDAKGTMFVKKYKDKKYLSIAISVSDKKVTAYLQKLLGRKGHVSNAWKKNYHSKLYRITIHGNEVMELIELLRPYLKRDKYKNIKFIKTTVWKYHP